MVDTGRKGRAQERAADTARHCHSVHQRADSRKTFEAQKSFLAIVTLWTGEHERTEQKWKSDCTDPVRDKFATILLMVSFGS